MENARTLEVEPLPEKEMDKQMDKQMETQAAHPSPSHPPMRKKPLYAGILALFPGIGNVYNGLYLRGAVFFALVASLLAMASDQHGDHPILGFTVAFVWIFNVIDSVRQAKLINFGYTQDLGLEDLPKIPKAGQGGLLAGILFLVLGAVACLEVFFKVDLSWLIGYWPIAPILIGAGLIAAWYHDRTKRGDEA
jgi:hypothetical protein